LKARLAAREGAEVVLTGEEPFDVNLRRAEGHGAGKQAAP